MSAPGYAVIDFETTGLFPGGHDRIIEVAIVHTDATGRVTGQWETLLNPGRDLGRQDIHRIRAADTLAAPTFEQIAAEFVELLSGRVIVAHNASFDTRFLGSELARMGYHPDTRVQGLCTMQLAREFLPGAGRSLADCCAAYDIELVDAHRASADALATARLLEAYISSSPMWEGWSEHLTAASIRAWPPLSTPRAAWFPRPADAATRILSAADFIERVTLKLPEHGGPAEYLDYLALLDRCLLDRRLSAHEASALVAMAENLGIDRDTCVALHQDYFASLTVIAWADGILTAEEIDDLLSVATLLNIPTDRITMAMTPPRAPRHAASELPAETPRFALVPGDRIVLTGEMSRPRNTWHRELEESGFIPCDAVTKKVKLVVAADPDSLSGKARKARDYGIPVIAESALARLIGSRRSEPSA